MSASSLSVQKEFLFTENDFNYLSQLVGETTGITLKKEKRELVYGRLTKRLRVLGLTNFKQYCDRLRDGDDNEMANLINSITTNVTNFFREIHHFEFLQSTLLHEIAKSKTHQSHPKLRIWSAGCSSGNEPYSIAIVLKETIKNLNQWDAKILATDLDSNILSIAKEGVYPSSIIDKVSDSRKKKWFKYGSGSNQGSVKVSQELIDLIRFKQLNLIEEWPLKGLFDIIFCRNVAIYFDKNTREKLVDRFADHLTDNGYLFVGHSETLHGISNRFECVGKTIYRKIS